MADPSVVTRKKSNRSADRLLSLASSEFCFEPFIRTLSEDAQVDETTRSRAGRSFEIDPRQMSSPLLKGSNRQFKRNDRLCGRQRAAR
jgi:hypothetical protein